MDGRSNYLVVVSGGGYQIDTTRRQIAELGRKGKRNKTMYGPLETGFRRPWPFGLEDGPC